MVAGAGLYENLSADEGMEEEPYFRDITATAGLGGDRYRQFWSAPTLLLMPAEETQRSRREAFMTMVRCGGRWGGAAADYDNDGLLDLCLLPLNGMTNYEMHRDGRGTDPDPSFVSHHDIAGIWAAFFQE